MKNKTYISFLNEISKEEIFEGLLGYGLFSETLPPIFSSESFMQYCKKNKNNFEDRACDYIIYETIRNISTPRLISIPTPFVYANLCRCIEKYWDCIRNKLDENTCGQKHKISQIHLRKIKDSKALFKMNYKNALDKNDKEDSKAYSKEDPSIDLMIGEKYKVEADISNCFPSIYSHSIPWALVGKEVAKKNKTKSKEWYNRLDTKVTCLKRKETNGLLIGIHSSNLISEIILTSVDKALYDKGYKFVRFIDDYDCFVNTYEQAEKFLLDLSQILKKYELTLNAKKTKIISLPLSDNEDWVNSLVKYSFQKYIDKEDNREYITLKSLRTFLDIAINLTKESNNASILNYAIKIISKYKFKDYVIDYYIKRIHHFVLLYPYLTRQLDKYIFDKFNVNVEIIKKIGDDLFKLGINKSAYEICSFVLYWSIKYDYHISTSFVDEAIQSKDCIFLATAYLKVKIDKNTQSQKKLRKYAKELMNENLMEKYWLFVYEVLSKKTGEETGLQGSWMEIKRKDISFFRDIKEIREIEKENKEE